MSCGDTCRGACDWYLLWSIRNRSLKVASVLLLLAFFLDLIALSTAYWMTGQYGYSGLFDIESETPAGHLVPTPIICPALAVLSAVLLFVVNILNILFLTSHFYLIMPSIIVLAFVAALMLMLVVVIFAVPDHVPEQNVSWSFIVASGSVVVDMTACGICVSEFLAIHSRSRTSLARNRAPTEAPPRVETVIRNPEARSLATSDESDADTATEAL